MSRPRLHLDADSSMKALLPAFVERGQDVTRTPNDWTTPDASDEAQLLAATAQGRCVFAFNVRDFVILARSYPRHGGIVLARDSRLDSARPHQLSSGLTKQEPRLR